jgi:tetratricopeptide (TPR) repeat protein
MMKSIRKATKANEEGAILLEVGETIKALRQFRAALKLLNEGCQATINGLPSAMQDKSEKGSLFGAATVRSLPILLGEDAQNASIPLLQQRPENPIKLYSQAFVFQDAIDEDMTIEKHSFFSALLIYNTALALHQKGGKDEGHKAYIKALLFYNESMNLLRSVADDADAFRVIQEITKNQADIYYKLNDLGNVHRVWAELAYLTKEHNLGSCPLQKKTPGAPTA